MLGGGRGLQVPGKLYKRLKLDGWVFNLKSKNEPLGIWKSLDLWVNETSSRSRRVRALPCLKHKTTTNKHRIMKVRSFQRHLPWHLLPVEERENPSGHRHLKLPSVLLQVPKAQISGSSTHSSISKRVIHVRVRTSWRPHYSPNWKRTCSVFEWFQNPSNRDAIACDTILKWIFRRYFGQILM